MESIELITKSRVDVDYRMVIDVEIYEVGQIALL
jgi:hypothetical protein